MNTETIDTIFQSELDGMWHAAELFVFVVPSSVAITKVYTIPSRIWMSYPEC